MTAYCEQHERYHDTDLETDCEFCELDQAKIIGEQIVEFQNELEVLETEFLETTNTPFGLGDAKKIVARINELNSILLHKRLVLMEYIR